METYRTGTVLASVLSLLVAVPVVAADMPRCMPLALPIAVVEAPPPAYADFCGREAGVCALRGASVIPWTEQLQHMLGTVNRAVNDDIRRVADSEFGGPEELWSFPEAGVGDCEDLALEKRRRLVAAGVPGAALTCAIVVHEVQLFPHAILLAETTTGTWVLDDLHDDLLCWDAVPYLYILRERPDGLWSRFQLP
ncbi:MAG: transglutaminase-like cysteine peptidase [Paracoccaceae bacterium]|jgi:predicted transglutaminase-like cysteine proteinase|nr:transglutaminase-like cysteine peptidase [Paracoccaceae bacterium]